MLTKNIIVEKKCPWVNADIMEERKIEGKQKKMELKKGKRE